MANRGVGRWRFDERKYFGNPKGNAQRCPKTGKVKYHSREDAEAQKYLLETSGWYVKEGEKVILPYECPHCRKWHIGNGYQKTND